MSDIKGALTEILEEEARNKMGRKHRKTMVTLVEGEPEVLVMKLLIIRIFPVGQIQSISMNRFFLRL